jgi:TnpA family transposase
VNVGVRDSTYVLDGLLYHESDLRIEEHYTDTAGFTDHVFALMHLLGFRFAPRIRDLGDTKLYIPKGDATYEALKPMIGGTLNIKHIRAHWDEILRLATSIKQGTVTASLMLGSSAATRARTAWPWPCASWAASSARCSFWTGCKASSCAAACMAEQGRGAQRAGPRRVLQPPG